MSKLFIERNFHDGSAAFHLINDQREPTRIFFTLDKKGQVVRNEDDGTCPSPPLLILPRGLADDFIRGIAEYAEREHIKTESKDFSEGCLKAQAAHLNREMLMVDRLMEKKK